jgi:hypothetical protein
VCIYVSFCTFVFVRVHATHLVCLAACRAASLATSLSSPSASTAGAELAVEKENLLARDASVAIIGRRIQLAAARAIAPTVHGVGSKGRLTSCFARTVPLEQQAMSSAW